MVRGEVPSAPSGGRSKAAGFRYGGQVLVNGQLELYNGLTSGTPGSKLGRLVYSPPEVVSPIPLLS